MANWRVSPDGLIGRRLGVGSRPAVRRSAVATGGRNATLDLLRLAAAFVIVLFHAGAPGGQYMNAAMAVFTALMGYLAMAERGAEPVTSILRRRARRLLRPFAIWAALYAALRLADAWMTGEPLSVAIASWLPPLGTMGQLWFLPFAFAASLAVMAARRALPELAPPALALALAVTASAIWLVMLEGAAPVPGLAVYFNFMPALFFGMALASTAGQPLSLVATGGAALALGLWLGSQGIGHTQQLTLGLPLLVIAMHLRRPGGRWSRIAGELSMVVYLLHLFILAVLLRFLPFPMGSLALGLLVAGLSAAAGLALLRSGFGRRLF